MNNQDITFDPVWDKLYGEGHNQRYPWDKIVSFVFRYYPRDQPRDQVTILEVGCGTGSNLWFAAREGFNVTGIDGSLKAIEYAQERFSTENLSGNFYVGDFVNLPFKDNSFHLVIDRAALTCCGFSSAKRAISEIGRVLKPRGHFHFNPYSDRHSSYAASIPGRDGVRDHISQGSLTGNGQICFYNRSRLEEFFSSGWAIERLQHLEHMEMQDYQFMSHAEWVVVAEKQ